MRYSLSALLLAASLSLLPLDAASASNKTKPSKRATKPAKIASSDIRVYALQYGKSWFRTRNILARKTGRKYTQFAWLFYLVRTPKRNILIDSGFIQRRYIRSFGIKGYTPPSTLLNRLGLKPSSITDVIATHSHWDHAGGLSLFPKARIILHRKTYRTLRWSRRLPKVRKAVRQAKKEKRLILNNKKIQLLPNLNVVHVGGHTRGSQVVFLKIKTKTFIFVGDECYLQKACRKGWRLPGRSASSTRRNRRFMKRLRQWTKDPNVVPLTGHDPAIMKHYNKVAKHIVRIYP